jgi:hypothetical protein
MQPAIELLDRAVDLYLPDRASDAGDTFEGLEIMTTKATNTQFAAALRALADIYDAHPVMEVPARPLGIWLFGAKREAFAATVKALGSCRKIEPKPNDYFFTVEKVLEGVPIQFSTERSSVCRKVRVVKEVDDWDCSDPLLESLVSSATEAAVTA